jgi:hypothetical protein
MSSLTSPVTLLSSVTATGACTLQVSQLLLLPFKVVLMAQHLALLALL